MTPGFSDVLLQKSRTIFFTNGYLELQSHFGGFAKSKDGWMFGEFPAF